MEHDEARYGSIADEYLPMATLLQEAIRDSEFLLLSNEYVFQS
jgi:hypothetical protein